MVWRVGGRPKVVWHFAITGGTITHIEMLADPDRLKHIPVNVLA